MERGASKGQMLVIIRSYLQTGILPTHHRSLLKASSFFRGDLVKRNFAVGELVRGNLAVNDVAVGDSVKRTS